MRVCVLCSGSGGNCTYIETSDHKILIDTGHSFSYLTSKLNEIGVDPNKIDTILITHSHIDHINSLGPMHRKFKPNLYISELMVSELKKYIPADYIEPAETITLGNTTITTIKTSHDVLDSNAYIVSESGVSVLYMTDTGYINQKYFDVLSNLDFYIFESNHDVDMLMQGSKPYPTKIRVLGDSGHLCNVDSANYLSKFIGDKTKYVVLAHISEHDNTEELAYNTLKNTLKDNNISFDNIILAKQNERTELFEL